MLPLGWLLWLIVGVFAGWLANLLVPGRLKLASDIVVGSVAALISGYLFNVIGAADPTNFRAWSVTVAFGGAVIVLGVVRKFIGLREPA